MSLTATVRALVSAGATPEMILAVVEVHEAEATEARDRRREKDAERQRRWRERLSRGVTRTERDLPKQKVSPTPPSKTQTILTPSPPKGGSVPTISEAFDRFWEAYPRRVAKAEARKAFGRAWKKLPAFEEEAILSGGLERAKAGWADPMFVPHAATWLNQERWADETVVVPFKTEPSPFAKWLAAKEGR